MQCVLQDIFAVATPGYAFQAMRKETRAATSQPQTSLQLCIGIRWSLSLPKLETVASMRPFQSTSPTKYGDWRVMEWALWCRARRLQQQRKSNDTYTHTHTDTHIHTHTHTHTHTHQMDFCNSFVGALAPQKIDTVTLMRPFHGNL